MKLVDKKSHKEFKIKLIEEQRYLEEHITNILIAQLGGTYVNAQDIVGILSDLFIMATATLLTNAPEGQLEEVRGDLLFYVTAWKENEIH